MLKKRTDMLSDKGYTGELLLAYMQAKETVIEAGYAEEIDWQESVDFQSVQESEFLREAAWVIFSCGMRESVLRQKFPDLSRAFLNFASARAIADDALQCRDDALGSFNHLGKVNAVICLASRISGMGYSEFKAKLEQEGIEYMLDFPYIGPASVLHLAKNIGVPVAKPDRHLNRVARKTGFPSPQIMCDEIANSIGEDVAVVDLVIWRFATLCRDYLESFPSRPGPPLCARLRAL